MKTNILFLLVLLLAYCGCKKDDDGDKTPANYFSLDGTVHALARGYLASGKICLTSEGMTIKGLEQATGNPIYEGTGELLMITGISGQNSITSGSYELNKIEGKVYTNYNPALTTYDYLHEISTATGSCTISLNGLQCSIHMSGTLNDATALKVRFAGELIGLEE